MNPVDSFQLRASNSLTESSDTAASCRLVEPADLQRHNHDLLKTFRLPVVVGAVLFSSGLLHLIVLFATGTDWTDPLSLRKPALFGISSGMTVWSIVWVLTQFIPRRGDQRLASLLSGGLLLEVSLITLQQWRGVASHFNRSTPVDALIESIMLGLILLVTAGVAWLCWRSRWLRPMAESQAIGIRAGLWMLLVSCGLGLLITITGEINRAKGLPPELWGPAGVLKYPHGAVLHAVQTLPVLSVLMQKLRVRFATGMMRSAVAAHLLFLGHALWQTFLGRARMDVDVTSVVLLTASGVLLLVPIVAIAHGAVATASTSRPANP